MGEAVSTSIDSNSAPVTLTRISTSAALNATFDAADAASSGAFEIDFANTIGKAATLDAINLHPGVTFTIDGKGYSLAGCTSDTEVIRRGYLPMRARSPFKISAFLPCRRWETRAAMTVPGAARAGAALCSLLAPIRACPPAPMSGGDAPAATGIVAGAARGGAGAYEAGSQQQNVGGGNGGAGGAGLLNSFDAGGGGGVSGGSAAGRTAGMVGSAVAADQGTAMALLKPRSRVIRYRFRAVV